MLAIVVLVSTDSAAPKNSTILPTTPCARRRSVIVNTRSVAVTPGRSAPTSSTPTTGGTTIDTGNPSRAAVASMPPMPQPRTPSPLTIVVCESVPRQVSGNAQPSRRSTTRASRSMLIWCMMPAPGGITVNPSRPAPHFRKQNRSAWRSCSTSAFRARASGRPEKSVETEWSTVSSPGTTGRTASGSPPRLATASRNAARSVRTGTPLVSCRNTRDGRNSTATPAASGLSSASAAPLSPCRNRFSTRILRDSGNDSMPDSPASRCTR